MEPCKVAGPRVVVEAVRETVELDFVVLEAWLVLDKASVAEAELEAVPKVEKVAGATVTAATFVLVRPGTV